MISSDDDSQAGLSECAQGKLAVKPKKGTGNSNILDAKFESLKVQVGLCMHVVLLLLAPHYTAQCSGQAGSEAKEGHR
jgi:hypothetical protein